MKNYQCIFIQIILCFSSFALATDFDFNGDTGSNSIGGASFGGSSGGGIDLTPSFSNPVSDLLSSINSSQPSIGGIGTNFADLLNSTTSTNNSSWPTTSTNESSPSLPIAFGTSSHGSDTSGSIFSSINNLLSTDFGANGYQVGNSGPHFFWALVNRTNLMAGFFDLNGDGYQGGWMDVWMYQTLFGDNVTTRGSPLNLWRPQINKKWATEARDNPESINVRLTENLADKTQSLEVKEIMSRIAAKSTSASDKIVLIETLMRIATFSPEIAWRALNSKEFDLRQMLGTTESKLIAAYHNKMNSRFQLTGPLEVAIRRLTLNLVIAELATKESENGQSEFMSDALRVSLYALATAIQKHKSSNDDEKKNYIAAMTDALYERFPAIMTTAANSIMSPTTIERLKDRLVNQMPYSQRNWPRRVLYAATIPAALYAWLTYGPGYVDLITENFDLQYYSIRGAILPIAGSLAYFSSKLSGTLDKYRSRSTFFRVGEIDLVREVNVRCLNKMTPKQ